MSRSARVALTVAAAVMGLVVFGRGIARAQAAPAGPSVQQYSGYARWPAVAYDSNNGVHLVVWGNSTIRGIFVGGDGLALGAAFQISDTSVYAQSPRVAFSPDAGAFLVVWQSSDGVTTSVNGTRVRGRMVSFTTGVSAAATQVYSNPTYTTLWERGPALAYSSVSKRFMVAYSIVAATGGEIGARLIDNSGAPLYDEIAVTATSADNEREPAVGYFPSTDRFVVAYSGNGTSSDFVRARLYGASNGAAAGPALTVTETSITYVPDLALNSETGQMFVVWIQADAATSAWRPFGAFLDDSGVITSASARLSATAGAYDANSIAYNPLTRTFFLVTHGSTAQDVGFEISGAGSPVAEAAIVTSVAAAASGGAFNPRIGASTLEPSWIMATAVDFASLWTQLIVGTDAGGGGGTVNPRLTIAPVPTGGTVTGGGLTCGTGGTTCQVTLAEPASITLTAAPDSGFTFTTWGGSCSGTSTTTTVSVTSIKTCTATFTAVWGGAGTEPAGCAAAPTVTFSASPGPIGASVSQYSGGTQNPDVAYDKCQQVYLAVWGLGGTIRGRFVGENGIGIGDTFYISSGQFAQTPKVVYDPNLGNFLVAWHSSASETRTEVRSTIVTYPAGSASAGTVLSKPTYSTRWVTRPAIGYSNGSGHYLVAWSRYATDGADISARLVDTLGAAVGNEFDVAAGTGDYDREPTAGYFPAANRFLLAWAGSATGVDFVRGQLFDASTGAAYGSSISFALSSATYVPEAAFNSTSGNMFVVWVQPDVASGGWRPFGRFVNSDGALVSASTRLSATAGAYDANSVAYNPLSRTFFLVTHGSANQDVGFEINGEGTPLGAAAIVTSTSAAPNGGSFNPRIAASVWQPRWLIATAADFGSLWTQVVGGTQPANLYQLSMSAPSHGTVTGGTALNCGTGGSACSETYGVPTIVTLTATPDSGYLFTSWGGSCSGTSTSTTVTVDGVKTCTAAFTSTSTTFQLTVTTPSHGTVTGGGISCGTSGTGTCSATYAAPTSVTLTAAPDSGYSFTSWGGSCAGTSTSTTVTVDGARTCTATFVVTPVYQLTVTAPANGTVTGGGISCGTSGTGTCSVSFGSATPVTLTAAPASGYSFTSWGGSCAGTNTSTTITVDGAKTCTATFTAGLPTGPPYTMTISPVPTGGVITGAGLNCGTGGPVCSYTAPASMPYGMQATPAAGYTFTGWTGDCTGTNPGIYIMLSGARTCSATFTAPTTTYRLTVTTPANGTVTGAGISCGTSGTGTCSVTYASATPVTLTAAPASGYTFTGWGGSCAGTSTSTTVTVDGVKTCTATFAVPQTYQLTLTTPANGTVTGGGISCGTSGTGTCSVTYASATSVTLTAAPASGYAFTSWGGSCAGTSASITVTVDGVKTCTATFTAGLPTGPPYTMTISPAPTGGTIAGAGLNCGTGGSVCSYTAPASMPYGMQATPAAGYTFTGWTGDCTGTNSGIYIMLSGARTCSATFTAPTTTYRLTVTTPANGTVTGAGISCGTSGTGTCSVTYASATPVTLTAAPAAGYTFTGWGGSCAGASTSTTVTVDGVRTCTATFAVPQTYQLTVTTPANGTVTGGGISCGTSGTGTCSVTYASATSVTLTAAPASGYAFTSWGGSCAGTSASTTVTVDGVKTCTATFTAGLPTGPPYTMTISPAPTGGTITGAGLNCGTGGSVCSYTAPASMPYGMQATPAAGYTFTGWTGDCTGTNPGIYIMLSGARTCSATFTSTSGTTYQLNVTAPANGTVTGGGISCGTSGTGTCSVTYASATPVTLTAAPAAGSTFTGWGGSCAGTSTSTTVTVDGVKTCTATFTAGGLPTGPPYTMTISPVPTGGVVTGAGLNCGPGTAFCSVTMPASMPMGLLATPATGYTFTGWTGNCAGANPSIYILLGGARTCGATFAPTGTEP